MRLLDNVLSYERQALMKMSASNYSVEQVQIEPILIAGFRMRGKYIDCGKGFARIGRIYGRHAIGKPLMLCYDSEFQEEDADYEVAMPIRKGEPKEGCEVRRLAGGICLSLLHLGPYEELKRSYQEMLQYVKKQGVSCRLPTREVYHKGPGMIFRGNPKKYLTEIQFMLE